MRKVVRMRAPLVMAIAAAFAITLSTAVCAATIIVNSLVDPGTAGICALRDAIIAANSRTATNACAAGTGNDTINFKLGGAIALSSTLPQVTDHQLTINGAASPDITIYGGQAMVQIMQVASGAGLKLKNLTIAHGVLFNANGGGILNDGALIISNSAFSDNAVVMTNGFGSAGGAIDNEGTLTVTNSMFSGNTAFFDGGAILNDGTLKVTNSTFLDNATVEEAGGILNNGTLIVTNSTFSGNSNQAGNGGGIQNEGLLTVVNSTFSGNSCGTNNQFGNGGGIENDGLLTVINSTFSGNSASHGGGGIFNDQGLIVINSTFSRNSASAGAGGAISNSDFGSFKNTILAHSTGGNCSGTIIDARYNISDDNSCGFSATGSHNNTDPKLDPAGLKNNGGPTQTIKLVSGSPALDAIPLNWCTDQELNQVMTDQRGEPRPDNGENVCDIGALELQR